MIDFDLHPTFLTKRILKAAGIYSRIYNDYLNVVLLISLVMKRKHVKSRRKFGSLCFGLPHAHIYSRYRCVMI